MGSEAVNLGAQYESDTVGPISLVAGARSGWNCPSAGRLDMRSAMAETPKLSVEKALEKLRAADATKSKSAQRTEEMEALDDEIKRMRRKDFAWIGSNDVRPSKIEIVIDPHSARLHGIPRSARLPARCSSAPNKTTSTTSLDIVVLENPPAHDAMEPD